MPLEVGVFGEKGHDSKGQESVKSLLLFCPAGNEPQDKESEIEKGAQSGSDNGAKDHILRDDKINRPGADWVESNANIRKAFVGNSGGRLSPAWTAVVVLLLFCTLVCAVCVCV